LFKFTITNPKNGISILDDVRQTQNDSKQPIEKHSADTLNLEKCLKLYFPHSNFSKETLNKKGIVVAKLFMGEDFEEIKLRAKKYFKKIDFFKPNSSRDESRETYIHCSGLST